MALKRWIVVALVTLTTSSLGPRLARADTYAWTDESGARHLTDRLSAVPEKYRDKAIRVGGAPSAAPQPSTPAPSAPSGSAAAAPSGPGGDEIFRMGEAPVARTPTTPTPAEPGPVDDKAANPTDQDGHDKHWWQQQMAGALNRQSRADDAVRTLESNKIVLSYGQPSDKTKYRDDLAKARKEKEAADKGVTDLQKRAKSAGAPASWLMLPGMEAGSNARGGAEKSQP